MEIIDFFIKDLQEKKRLSLLYIFKYLKFRIVLKLSL